MNPDAALDLCLFVVNVSRLEVEFHNVRTFFSFQLAKSAS